MTEKTRDQVLLVGNPARRYPEAVDTAVEKASEEKRSLLVLYVLDSNLSEDLSQRLSNIGFLSEDVAEELTDVVKAEQYEQGIGYLQEAKRKAGAQKVDCEIQIQPGTMEHLVPLIVRRRHVRHVILPRKKRSRWAAWFSASQIEELAAQLPCKVTILDY